MRRQAARLPRSGTLSRLMLLWPAGGANWSRPPGTAPGITARLMANGQPFDVHADTAAHPTLPLGTDLRLSNPANGRSVEVQVTDRGPFIPGRNLDLSYSAAQKLGVVKAGVSRLYMERS